MKKNLRSTFEPKLCNKFARAFLITQDFEAGIEKFEGKISQFQLQNLVKLKRLELRNLKVKFLNANI